VAAGQRFVFLWDQVKPVLLESHKKTECKMKAVFTAILVLAASASASAKGSKVCFGTDDAKGSRFSVEVSRHQIVISDVVGDAAEGYEGTYKYSGQLTGRDGKKYGEFPTRICDSGCAVILVDDKLSSAGSKGRIKLRWRGEGFQETVFLCRDSK
jgi:hypothetical protein